MWEDTEPYDLLIKHEHTIAELLAVTNDLAHNGQNMAKQLQELSNIFVRLYTDHQSLQHRVTRLERTVNATI